MTATPSAASTRRIASAPVMRISAPASAKPTPPLFHVLRPAYALCGPPVELGIRIGELERVDDPRRELCRRRARAALQQVRRLRSVDERRGDRACERLAGRGRAEP